MKNLLDPINLQVTVPSRAPTDRSETVIGLWMQRELRRVMRADLPFVQVVNRQDADCTIRIHNLTVEQEAKIWPHLESIGVQRGATEHDGMPA